MATVSDGWVRSSFCDSSACIEVLKLDEDLFLLRRSADINPLPTCYTRAEIEAFAKGWQAGEFD